MIQNRKSIKSNKMTDIHFERTGNGLVGSININGTLFLSRGENKKEIKKEINDAIKNFAS